MAFFNYSSLAHVANQQLKSNGINIGRSHLNEVLAALLGYGTYAAYHADDTNPDGPDLEEAEYLVLAKMNAISRAQVFGFNISTSEVVVEALAAVCVQQIPQAASGPIEVFSSMEDFEDLHLREYMEQESIESDAVNSEMANTNAYFDGDIDLEEIVSQSDYIMETSTWLVNGYGVIHLDQDPDRPYSGTDINFSISVGFEKVGRIGLRNAEADVWASVDHEEDYV